MGWRQDVDYLQSDSKSGFVQRDEEYLKDQFRQTFMETVYPSYHMATLPAYRPGDFENQQVCNSCTKKWCSFHIVGYCS